MQKVRHFKLWIVAGVAPVLVSVVPIPTAVRRRVIDLTRLGGHIGAMGSPVRPPRMFVHNPAS